jgi:DNA-binding Lrp family transcriptional regulator
MTDAYLDNPEMEFSELELRLLDEYQHDLPLTPQPFAEMGRQLGVSEARVLEILDDLSGRGVVSRVGPVLRPHSVGVSTLAAMAVPKDRLRQVARLVSALPQVNHNYEREHHFNLWFVVTAHDDEELAGLLADIEQRTGLTVMSLPMLEDFHIDLGFRLRQGP